MASRQLGTLFIAIVKDWDGFQICLVSSETFDPAVLAAADFKPPDFALRAELAATRKAEAEALARKRAAAATVGVLGGSPGTVYVAPPPGTPLLDRARAVVNHVFHTFAEDEVRARGRGLWALVRSGGVRRVVVAPWVRRRGTSRENGGHWHR